MYLRTYARHSYGLLNTTLSGYSREDVGKVVITKSSMNLSPWFDPRDAYTPSLKQAQITGVESS